MTVHFLRPEGTCYCGAKPQKRLLGLDFVNTWNNRVATPVDCIEALLHRPFQRKVKVWEGVGRKVR